MWENNFKIPYILFQDSYWPVLTHFLAIFLGALGVTRGVKTIEKVSMLLVPLLLVIILFTFIWSLTRKFTDIGIKFLFTPHWGMIVIFIIMSKNIYILKYLFRHTKCSSRISLFHGIFPG